MKSIKVKDEAVSYELAKQIAKIVEPGMIILLEGDLGAGKTTFTKGLAQGLDITRVIKSPTYTIIREYTNGRLPLYHMDLYRLSDDEADLLGLEEYFEGEGVCVIEWPSVARETMPSEFLEIKIDSHFDEPNERVFHLTPHGNRYEALIKQLN